MPGRRPSDASRTPRALLRRLLTLIIEYAADAVELSELGEVNAHLVVRHENGGPTATIHGWTDGKASTVRLPHPPATVSGWCSTCSRLYRWTADMGARSRARCRGCLGSLGAVPRGVEAAPETQLPKFTS